MSGVNELATFNLRSCKAEWSSLGKSTLSALGLWVRVTSLSKSSGAVLCDSGMRSLNFGVKNDRS